MVQPLDTKLGIHFRFLKLEPSVDYLEEVKLMWKVCSLKLETGRKETVEKKISEVASFFIN